MHLKSNCLLGKIQALWGGESKARLKIKDFDLEWTVGIISLWKLLLIFRYLFDCYLPEFRQTHFVCHRDFEISEDDYKVGGEDYSREWVERSFSKMFPVLQNVLQSLLPLLACKQSSDDKSTTCFEWEQLERGHDPSTSSMWKKIWGLSD